MQPDEVFGLTVVYDKNRTCGRIEQVPTSDSTAFGESRYGENVTATWSNPKTLN